MNRRKFMRAAGAVSASILLAKQALAHEDGSQAHDEPKIAANDNKNLEGVEHNAHHQETMKKYAAFAEGEKVVIGMLVYPGMFLQDLVGPLTMFESLMNRDIHLVWKDKNILKTADEKTPALISVAANTTFAECPKNLDVLFVPGGVPGTFNLMEDAEVLAFLKDRGAHAKYVTSVCTGSLILGAAGLLKGYKATSHWATFDALSELGAIPTRQRVVEDRNRITGGGVTAGMDFGLLLVARLRNQTYAEGVQLYLEYDPQPPFNAGTPDKAPAIVNQFIGEMFAPLRQAAIDTSKRVYKKLPV